MLLRFLNAFSITLLSLGSLSLIGLLSLANYDSNHCAEFGVCTSAGIAEGIMIMIFSAPMIVVGFMTSIIAYFLNRKKQQVEIQGNRKNFNKILLTVAILIFVLSSILLVPEFF